MTEILTREEELEIIEYGIERIKANILGMFTIFLIGIIFGVFAESMIFAIFFFLQRRYAGGYHADTKGRCYIVSVFLITISMCFIKYIDSGIVICFVLQTFNIIIIYLLAPVGTANRELDRVEIAVFRKRARIIGSISYVLACCFYMNSCFRISTICVSAADRISWNKRMISGYNIQYWVSSDVTYESDIRSAETEIEIPSAGYSNPMKMTKTTEKKQSKMDFYQYSDANSSTVASTYSYLPGSHTPMNVNDKDNYDWQWCKIELNKPQMDEKTYNI